MKKLRLNLMFVAVIIGSIGAFAFKPANNHNRNKIGGYDYWFDPTGSTYSGHQNYASDEATLTGCDGTITAPCQNGYTDAQLNTSGHPEDGVITAQKMSPDDQILVHGE